MGGRGQESGNCRRMVINTQVQKICMEEEVGFIDMWLNFVDMWLNFHLTGCEFVRLVNEGTGTVNYLN